MELCNPNAPPSERYVVRLILIYGRTHCTPQISAIESLKHSFDNPYFFVDVLYLHEAEEIPEIRNKCVVSQKLALQELVIGSQLIVSTTVCVCVANVHAARCVRHPQGLVSVRCYQVSQPRVQLHGDVVGSSVATSAFAGEVPYNFNSGQRKSQSRCLHPFRFQ